MAFVQKSWNDKICEQVDQRNESLEKCKSLCQSHPTCCVINYSTNKYPRCILMKCPYPIPVPNDETSDYDGYHLKIGQYFQEETYYP